MCQHRCLNLRIHELRIHKGLRFGLQRVGAGVLLLCVAGLAPGASLSSVKTVYIETLGTKPGASDLAKRLAGELEKTAGLRLTANKDLADAYVQGDGEIWTRGHISLNPRAGNAPGRGQPVHGGVLSVELRGRDNSVLWSYLATPHSGAADVPKDLSRQVAKSLKTAIDKERRP